MKNIKNEIKKEFESGNYNISLIASRLDIGRAALWKRVHKDEDLRIMYEAHRRVVMEEQELKHREIALFAMERGIGAAAYKYKAPTKYILACMHKQKDSSEIARNAKASDKASGFYQIGFYY